MSVNVLILCSVIWFLVVDGIDDVIKTKNDSHVPSSCDWIRHEGIDLFHNSRCQLGGAIHIPKVRSAEACAEACDARENGECKAWSKVGFECFLTSCVDQTIISRRKEVHPTSATSAIRRDDKKCGQFRNWHIKFAWLESWRSLYGTNQTFLTHKRRPEDSIRFGPIVTIRGERHSGTNWVRALVNHNCKELLFHFTPDLDADGVYAWKHGLSPLNWSQDTKDIMIFILRSASSWLPKMRHTAYNTELDRHRTTSLASFLEIAISDPNDREIFDNVLDMRTRKYKDYRDLTIRCPQSILAIRYEDLLKDGGAFVIKQLKQKLPFECGQLKEGSSNTTFLPITNYAKFGAVSPFQRGGHDSVHTWSSSDWTAFLHHLDADLETDVGYRYSPTSAGTFEVIEPILPTWLTLPPP
uniref:Apple domain-containing protein n=1 Tax=Aureoumbra lagunensis TaxID=44058 RepID=A0A7S3K106_9STRA